MKNTIELKKVLQQDHPAAVDRFFKSSNNFSMILNLEKPQFSLQGGIEGDQLGLMTM